MTDDSSRYTLTVVVAGTFVAMFDPNNTKTFDIYAPECGHTYGAIFEDDTPRSPWDVMDDHVAEVQLLDPKSYRLPLKSRSGNPSVPRSLDLQKGGLWFGFRPIDRVWDLRITLPLPDGGIVKHADKVKLRGSVGGKDGEAAIKNPTFATLTQEYSYKGASGEIDLCGSELPPYEPAKKKEHVTLYIFAEQPFKPTWKHQRQAVDVFANMLGLDLYLKAPLKPADPKGRMSLVRNGANCGTGGSVGGQ